MGLPALLRDVLAGLGGLPPPAAADEDDGAPGLLTTNAVEDDVTVVDADAPIPVARAPALPPAPLAAAPLAAAGPARGAAKPPFTAALLLLALPPRGTCVVKAGMVSAPLPFCRRPMASYGAPW